MDNSRLDEMVFLMSYLKKLEIQEAKKLVLSTETGNAILNENESVLYEQDTANFSSIIFELQYEPIDNRLLHMAISEYYNKIGQDRRKKITEDEKNICKRFAAIEDKSFNVNAMAKIKERYKQKILEKQREYNSIRRIEYAINVKRQSR